MSVEMENGVGVEEAPDYKPDPERANLLEKVRGLREEAKRDHHIDLALPGMKGYVWARFRPFAIEKTERKLTELARAAGQQPIMLKASCDILIDACEQIFLLPDRHNGDIGPEGVNLIAIDDEAIPPIAFDARLASVFGFEAATARQVVIQMIPTEQAIIALSGRVSAWMQDVTRETDSGLLGE